ncbi:unnamed protein product [Paramecium primaurelia]|uniref:PX domain-containing protein n=1 Tax=Paramecium primaurelia TaxID=5886 RepID=A0A8S1JRL5_PARPR|nr:unnamed protein product [Paramecium primaurelia]
MENLLDSQHIEAMINANIKNIIKDNSLNKEIFNLLSDQQQQISQTILVDDPVYINGHYYYPIKTGNIIVNRRYGEFVLLAEYLFKTQPEILQKPLPQKEFGVIYLFSFIQENTQLLKLRKQKFQIYINDIKKQLPNNQIIIKFLENPQSFYEQIVNIDYSLIQQQRYIEKIKNFYETKWLQSNNESGELNTKKELLQTKIIHLDQIQTHLVILYLNLQYKTKSSEIYIQQNEIQELVNKIIKNQELYQDDLSANKLERLTKKIGEVIELYQNVRTNKNQFDSFEKLLDDCLKLVIFTLKELQK